MSCEAIFRENIYPTEIPYIQENTTALNGLCQMIYSIAQLYLMMLGNICTLLNNGCTDSTPFWDSVERIMWMVCTVKHWLYRLQEACTVDYACLLTQLDPEIFQGGTLLTTFREKWLETVKAYAGQVSDDALQINPDNNPENHETIIENVDQVE